jgi:TolB protein
MSALHSPKFPQPFTGQSDVGTLNMPGEMRYDPQRRVITLRAAGANIWGDHDDFHFLWRRMRGDFIATVRASLLGQGVNPHRKLGWMARAGLSGSAANVCTGIHGDGLLTLQFRRTPGAQTEEVRSSLKGADVIQLERRGNQYIMSVAHWGQPFTIVSVDEVSLGDEVYLGLYLCSHEPDVVETAEFSDVRVSVPVAAGFDRERDPFGSRLEILDVENGAREVVYRSDTVFEAPNWTRDGRALIYNSCGRLYRFDLATRRPSLIDTGAVVHNNNDHVLSFDGSRLAISSHSGPQMHSMVYTLPLAGGEPHQVTPVGPSYLHGWSPDGRYLVFTGQRNGEFDIYRVPVDGGPEENLTRSKGLDDGPEYTPDGRFIYFNSVRSGSMQIWRMRPDGSQPEQLTDDAYNNWFPHVSPDGSQVVFVSYLVGEVEPNDHPPAKRVYLRSMPLDGGQPSVVAYLYGGQGTMNVPSWSPDGKQIAFVSNTMPFKE